MDFSQLGKAKYTRYSRKTNQGSLWPSVGSTAVPQRNLITVKKAQSRLVPCPPLCTQYSDVTPKGGKPVSQGLELTPQTDETNRSHQQIQP